MRRAAVLSAVVAVLLLVALATGAQGATGRVTVLFNGQQLVGDAPAHEHFGRIFVPVDAFAQLTATEYQWDGSTLLFNAVPVADMEYENGTLYADVRVLAGILAASATWDEASGTLSVGTPPSPEHPDGAMVSVNYNGHELMVPFEGPHRHMDHVYVPVESFAVLTGVNYSWDGTTLVFGNGSLDSRQDSSLHPFEGRLYAPVRPLARLIGARVTWDGANQQVNLVKLPDHAILLSLDGWNERWQVTSGNGTLTYGLVKGRLSYVETTVDGGTLGDGISLAPELGLPAPTRVAMTPRITAHGDWRWTVRLSFD